MVDILAFGAHPDDVEMGCGGILIKAADQGKSIAICDLTLGDKGTHGTPDIRRQEARNAAKLIGAERTSLEFPDCGVIDSYEGRLELVKVIRHYKPKLVLAQLWKGERQHPDHFAAGSMARIACRLARFSKILPELPIHMPDGILHYHGAGQETPDFVIDITPYVDTWKKMIEAHQSQMQTRPYIEWCTRAASRMGMLIGVPYAQALSKGNPIAIDDPMTIARGTIEL